MAKTSDVQNLFKGVSIQLDAWAEASSNVECWICVCGFSENSKWHLCIGLDLSLLVSILYTVACVFPTSSSYWYIYFGIVLMIVRWQRWKSWKWKHCYIRNTAKVPLGSHRSVVRTVCCFFSFSSVLISCRHSMALVREMPCKSHAIEQWMNVTEAYHTPPAAVYISNSQGAENLCISLARNLNRASFTSHFYCVIYRK